MHVPAHINACTCIQVGAHACTNACMCTHMLGMSTATPIILCLHYSSTQHCTACLYSACVHGPILPMDSSSRVAHRFPPQRTSPKRRSGDPVWHARQLFRLCHGAGRRSPCVCGPPTLLLLLLLLLFIIIIIIIIIYYVVLLLSLLL